MEVKNSSDDIYTRPTPVQTQQQSVKTEKMFLSVLLFLQVVTYFVVAISPMIVLRIIYYAFLYLIKSTNHESCDINVVHMI